MSITQESFGMTKDQQPVSRFVLKRSGITVSLIEYAAAIQQLLVPDRTGNLTDIVLGYDTIQGYEQGSGHQGAAVGRHANRLENAEFTLNGVTWKLNANNGRNNLHGGPVGFSKRVWHGEAIEDPDADAVRFSLHSPDGDQGFPGNLQAELLYRLDDQGDLTLDYKAFSDQDTLVNLTNHAYFNLAGCDSGPMLDQILTMPSEFYTPVNGEGLPNGEVRRVDDTAFDFREPKAIGQDIADPELQNVGGYDHNWVVPGPIGTLRSCAIAIDPVSGRRLEVLTTQPGVQFYTANFLKNQTGKGGKWFGYRCGFCLETQCFPNAMRHAHFPSPVLKAGVPYHHVTVFRLMP